MAQKKIDDVKRAGKVTPSASSRPIIVTNRPVLASDPMVVPEATSEPEKSDETKLTVRTGKTIQPVSESLQDTEKDASKPDEQTENPTEPEITSTEAKPVKEGVEKPAEAADTEQEKPAEPAETPPTEEGSTEPTERDVDAAAAAADAEAEAERQARESELEGLIASGKYAVPINAVGRKRSRMHIILFCLLALILAAALADVLLDMGTISVPKSVPHTHFFTVQ